MGENEIENWECSICSLEITHVTGNDEDYDEVKSDTHFDISRTKKVLYVDDGEIVEDTKESYEKMSIIVCEDCFVKILNESKILGNLFLDKKLNKFVY